MKSLISFLICHCWLKPFSPFPFGPTCGQIGKRTLSSRPFLVTAGNIKLPCWGTFPQSLTSPTALATYCKAQPAPSALPKSTWTCLHPPSSSRKSSVWVISLLSNALVHGESSTSISEPDFGRGVLAAFAERFYNATRGRRLLWGRHWCWMTGIYGIR